MLFCGEHWAMPEWFIGRHQHDVWEFYLQLNGVSEWAGPKQHYRLEPGGFLAVGPGIAHQMVKRVRQKHHFDYAALDLAVVLRRHPTLREAWQNQSLIHRPSAASLVAPFRQLIREVTLAQPNRPVGMRLALDALVLEATRALTGASGASLVDAHPAVVRVKELLDHQFQQPWRLADLARVAGVSPTHLAELFTRDVGIPPRQYLLQVRIERAKEYLTQKLVPITTLALELGFSSSQHFAAAFRRLTGKSPREHVRQTRTAGLKVKP
ncbi:MAG: Virulence regulon transcriptional activator VirF [Verrucomicrobiae bacterium]|nr:Virulence regulon transcriptional activator VirF [Verrucomicrobiae bacterium]